MFSVLAIVVFFLSVILSLLAFLRLCTPDDWKRKILWLNVFKKEHLLKIFNPDFNVLEEESGKSFICCDENSEEPGVPPTVSDQGQSVTCSLHATSKGIVSLLDKKGFDADQDEIVDRLENEMGTNRIWPNRCNGREITVQAKKKDSGIDIDIKLKLIVDDVDFGVICATKIPDKKHCEYVICTKVLSKNDLHSIYIEKKTKNSPLLSCINSWGSSNAYPILVAKSSNTFFQLRIKIMREKKDNKTQNPTPSKGNFRVTENVGTTVSDLLASIPVSKKKHQDYNKKLKGQDFSKWKETAKSKVFRGVKMAKYKEFLDNFQETTGIDDKMRKDFDSIMFITSLNNSVKVFSSITKGTKKSITGKYGLYAALKNPQAETVDVAYSMYTYTAEIMGRRPDLEFNVKCKKSEPFKSGVEDVNTGETMDPGQNWLLHQALTNFVQTGTIKRVNYVEDTVNET